MLGPMHSMAFVALAILDRAVLPLGSCQLLAKIAMAEKAQRRLFLLEKMGPIRAMHFVTAAALPFGDR